MKKIIFCLIIIFQVSGVVHAQIDNSDIDIVQYADSYANLDANKATKLITEFMHTTDEYNKLHKIYFRKAEKAIGGLKAAEFIQLETMIQTALQSNLQSQIPVIGELKLIDPGKQSSSGL